MRWDDLSWDELEWTRMRLDGARWFFLDLDDMERTLLSKDEMSWDTMWWVRMKWDGMRRDLLGII